ncbi:MAG: 50S ribosomal protein L29 [Candidatus Adiutrix sp.]|nr:50S ribosomal protein L29 [Candidatus Adiutrix sp.]
MKSKEIKELRGLSPEDLNKRELELREELFNLQMQRGASQLENPKRLNIVKKDVARIQTVIRELKNQEAQASPNEA